MGMRWEVGGWKRRKRSNEKGCICIRVEEDGKRKIGRRGAFPLRQRSKNEA
jgi:hypothetical protein